MLLVLSSGGRRAAELAERLSALGADYIFHFESFGEAGGFGKGDVIVGKLSYRGLARIVKKNRVSAIADIIEAPASHGSLAAANVAEDLKIPLVKLIEPTVPRGLSVSADPSKVACETEYSYSAVASRINNTVGNAVFFSRPMNVRVIAEQVFDRSALYVPILAGGEFDVDLALQYGVPLMNVKEYDSITGKDGMLNILRDTGAKLLITDSALGISDKLAAAGEVGARVIFTQSCGFEYENIFDNIEALCGFLEENGLLTAERDFDGPEGAEEPKNKELINENRD